MTSRLRASSAWSSVGVEPAVGRALPALRPVGLGRRNEGNARRRVGLVRYGGGRVGAVVAVVLVLVLALPAAIPAAREPAAARTSTSHRFAEVLGAAAGSASRALRPAVASAADDGGNGERAVSSPRLDRAVRGLRTDPLYVDPELGWTMGAATRRALRKTLRAARVPVLVAVLPRLDEDESGGDTERVLQVLQRGVGRRAVYVTADQRGRMDLASYGVPLDLSIPFGTLRPPYDDRSAAAQEADPAPPDYATVPGRIARIVGYVGRATAGPANGLVDELEPIEPLLGASDPPGVTGDVIAASIVGGLLGLLAAGMVLGVRRLFVASAVGDGGWPGGGAVGGRGAGGSAGGRGGRRRNRRPGTGKRRRRRSGARRGTGRDA